MAINVNHKFVSPKVEQSDPTIVGPNEWNASHNASDNSGILIATDYNFQCQTPNISLTGGVTNTVTLTPVPLGINGTDIGHSLYISGGTGTAESVLIIGGSAVSGAASGDITFVPTSSHTGAWTLCTATGGIQEAISMLPQQGGKVLVCQNTTLHANVTDANKMNVVVFQQAGAIITGPSFTIMGAQLYGATDNHYGTAAFIPIIDLAKNNGVGIYPVMTSPNNNSIIAALYVQQPDKTKLSSDTYLNGILIDIRSTNDQPNQNAGIMSFCYSYGGADPFGADCHALVPADATGMPHWCIGVQASTQIDKIIPGVGIYPLLLSHDSTAGQKATAMIWLTGESGSHFLLINKPSAFSDEGIMLQPNDDANPDYRAFGLANASGSQDMFEIRKNGNFYHKGFNLPAVGTPVASAVGITPSGPIFHVTGNATIVNMSQPTNTSGGVVYIIPDGAFTFTATGNIANAVTAVVGRVLTMVYDNNTAKWYPSY